MKFRLNEPTERKTFLTVSLSFFGANLMMEQLNPKKSKVTFKWKLHFLKKSVLFHSRN